MTTDSAQKPPSQAWKTEDDETPTPIRPLTPPKTEFKIKAYLALVDSDQYDWGIIEDTLSDLLWTPGKGEVVGTWTRTKLDNLIHVSLGTSLSALQDRSVQTFAKYTEERRLKADGSKKPKKKARTAAEIAQEQIAPSASSTPEISVDEKLKFNALRARLWKKK